jgi:hypothetical protein
MCKDCEGCEFTEEDSVTRGCWFYRHTQAKSMTEGFYFGEPPERCPWPSKRIEKRIPLKPCPFCGRIGWISGIIINIPHEENCYLFFSGAKPGSIIERWNTRHEK